MCRAAFSAATSARDLPLSRRRRRRREGTRATLHRPDVILLFYRSTDDDPALISAIVLFLLACESMSTDQEKFHSPRQQARRRAGKIIRWLTRKPRKIFQWIRFESPGKYFWRIAKVASIRQNLAWAINSNKSLAVSFESINLSKDQKKHDFCLFDSAARVLIM